MLRTLLVHNHYQQAGGEDAVFEAEAVMLEQRGHTVERLTFHNDDVDEMKPFALATNTVWNRRAAQTIGGAVKRLKAQVVHFHNTFPLVSPAAYYAARREGAAVVQTLHNFRLLCPGTLFLRDQKVCEDCLGKAVPWPGVVHKCYRDNRAATAVSTVMLSVHRGLGTWRKAVDRYIALTDFGKEKFIAGGLPSEKIVVKPNFVGVDPGVGTGRGGYAIFVGRLAREKGIGVMLDAWRQLGDDMPLKIVGDGPLAQQVESAAAEYDHITWLRRQAPDKVYSLVGDATCLVMPSQWYEAFGMTMIEAFAKGTPVVASNLGAMASLVTDGATGLLFQPGDPKDLEAKVRQLLIDPAILQTMRRAARVEYESKYNAQRNYDLLMQIYEQTIKHRSADHALPAGQSISSAI